MKVDGMEYLKELPANNVLFVSNHQTYFAEVFALNHIFCSDKWGFKNINFPIYLLAPKVKSYYIAAEETMQNDGLLPKIFSYAGAVTVKRSWRSNGKDVSRGADLRAPAKIKKALEYGWVINFPQGTTSPNAPVRKGTASLIKAFNPIVVPVKVDGFAKAFDKKGLKFKQKGVELSVKFSEPVQFGEDAEVNDIFQFLKNHLLGSVE
jgi:1-acyl-sn-glycerol-3-phosphate acyltransferase